MPETNSKSITTRGLHFSCFLVISFCKGYCILDNNSLFLDSNIKMSSQEKVEPDVEQQPPPAEDAGKILSNNSAPNNNIAPQKGYRRENSSESTGKIH